MLSSEIQGAGSPPRRELALRQQRYGENRWTVLVQRHTVSLPLARGSDCAGDAGESRLVAVVAVCMVAHGTSAGQW